MTVPRAAVPVQTHAAEQRRLGQRHVGHPWKHNGPAQIDAHAGQRPRQRQRQLHTRGHRAHHVIFAMRAGAAATGSTWATVRDGDAIGAEHLRVAPVFFHDFVECQAKWLSGMRR